MQVTVHQRLVSGLLDVLLPRWIARQYPYNRPDAVIPQTIIPEELRKDRVRLARFYFYVCIYMRGGIESLQAFNALILMWQAHPELFKPAYVSAMWPAEMREYLKKYIGWDSKAASENWVENSRRLMRNWSGNPLNLIKNLKNYDEALRRIQNKLTKREMREAGRDGEGFRGFQPKMVSMLLYFYDWEEWLNPRFLYPSPADFHNFRLGLANGAIVVTLLEGDIIRSTERISAPWREAVMAYLRERKADPIEVSDCLWLFSLLMCGNSPATVSKELNGGDTLFSHSGVQESWDHDKWIIARKRKQMEQTCLICPLNGTCRFGIPAKPYYRKGQLHLRKRLRLEETVDTSILREPAPQEVAVDPEVLLLLPHISQPAT